MHGSDSFSTPSHRHGAFTPCCLRLQGRQRTGLRHAAQSQHPRSNHELGSDLLLKPHLDRAVQRVQSRFNLGLRVQTVRNQFPGEARHFATFRATVGYALPDQAPLAAKLARGLNSPQTIPGEISLNEPMTEAERVRLNPALPTLGIASLNDIVAGKLRALLQQPIRNRHRRQDVLDLAVILGSGPASSSRGAPRHPAHGFGHAHTIGTQLHEHRHTAPGDVGYNSG